MSLAAMPPMMVDTTKMSREAKPHFMVCGEGEEGAGKRKSVDVLQADEAMDLVALSLECSNSSSFGHPVCAHCMLHPALFPSLSPSFPPTFPPPLSLLPPPPPWGSDSLQTKFFLEKSSKGKEKRPTRG